MITKITCAACGMPAYKNERGQVLAHTTTATGGTQTNPGMWGWSTPYQPAEICSSYRPGVRP